jgi:hypothetical protein
MFFVGASGQLITLILTVCLPFILILSGSEKIDIQKSTLSFYVYQDYQEVSTVDFNSFDFTQYSSSEIQYNKIEIEDSDPIKIPHSHFKEKWKFYYLHASGNKAPPVFHCIFC